MPSTDAALSSASTGRTGPADARLDGAAQRVGHAIIAAPKSAQYLDHEQRMAARALQDVSGERTLPGLAGELLDGVGRERPYVDPDRHRVERRADLGHVLGPDRH